MASFVLAFISFGETIVNLIQEILSAQNGKVVQELGKQFGLDSKTAEAALSNLIPAIAGGVKKAAQSPSALEALVAKMQNNPELQEAIQRPEVLSRDSVSDSGKDILGDIFGSKEVSRTVAGQTAQSTGVDLGVLKKMLPVIAGLVMSSLNQKGQASSSTGGLGDLLNGLNQPSQTSSGGLGSILGGLLGKKAQPKQTSSGFESLLDFNGDGNVSDDVLHLVRKLF